MERLLTWLDQPDQEKISILGALEHGEINLSKLSQQIKRSNATTAARVDELISDIAEYHELHAEVSWQGISGQNVQAIRPLEAGLVLRDIYADKAIALKLLLEAILGGFQSVPSFCLAHHIQKTNFWNIFKRVNELIKPYQLELSTRAGIHCKGDEIAIRLLVATLINYFHGDTPSALFSFETMMRASQTLDELPDIVYPKKDYKRRNFFIMLLLTTRQRMHLGHFLTQLPSVPLFPYSPNLASLKDFLAVQDERNVEIPFLCSFFISFAPYSSYPQYPDIAWLQLTTEGRALLDLHEQLLHQFTQHLHHPLRAFDFERLSFATLMTDYRVLLIQDLGALQVLMHTVADEHYFRPLHFFREEDISYAFQQMPAGLALFDQRFFYLIPALLEATFANVDITIYYPQISIMLISTSHSQVQRRLLQINGFFERFNLKVADSNTDIVDLIISDFSLTRLLEEKHTRSDVFYWHSVPTGEDLQSLLAKLELLTNSKKKRYGV